MLLWCPPGISSLASKLTADCGLPTPDSPLPTSHSRLHFRPHSLQPARPGEGLRTTVTRCSFAGPYYEVVLKYEGEEILMHAASAYDEGAILYATVKKDELFWLGQQPAASS